MAGKKTDEKNAGYILLHRRITEHWIWKDRDTRKLKWWLDILMQCNHDLQKVSIGWEIMECQRGESLKSLGTWSKRWGVDINTVRRFMKMLEKDHMIVTKSEQKTTRLTVCNYDSYNDPKQAKDTQKKSISKEKEFSETTNNALINTQIKKGSGEPPPADAEKIASLNIHPAVQGKLVEYFSTMFEIDGFAFMALVHRAERNIKNQN